MKNFNWCPENKKEETKETFYRSWKDFEQVTGISKEKYFDREKLIARNLAETEVKNSIFNEGRKLKGINK